MEDDLNEANLELTNVYRDLKSAKRQVAALSAQQILAQENEASALAALNGNVPQRPNHASCWVRQCLLQWSGNCTEARYRNQLEEALAIKVDRVSQGSSQQVHQFGAAQLYSIFQSYTRDSALHSFIQWRIVTQIRKTARWHLYLQEDANNIMVSRQTAWVKFAVRTVYLMKDAVQASAFLIWKSMLLEIKSNRVLDGAQSESLGRVLRQAVQKSGVETVRQVLLRWVNSCNYSKTERDSSLRLPEVD